MKNFVVWCSSKYVLGIVVKLEGAFDSLSWLPVLLKLDECACRELALLGSYFPSREPFGRSHLFRRHQSQSPSNLMMDELLGDLCLMAECVAHTDDSLILV